MCTHHIVLLLRNLYTYYMYSLLSICSSSAGIFSCIVFYCIFCIFIHNLLTLLCLRRKSKKKKKKEEIRNTVRVDGDLFCQQTKNPNSPCHQCYRRKAQGKHCHRHTWLQHNNRKCGNVTNRRQPSSWGGTIICDHLIKHPQWSSTKREPLKLSAHSLRATLQDIIITESSCKHVPRRNTNNSTEIGQLVPKRFYSLTNVVPVTKWDYIHSGRLTVKLIHRNLGSELQLNPTTFMSGNLCKYQLYTSHTSSSTLIFSEVKHTIF